MQPFYFTTLITILIAARYASAVLLPITGDSSAVWTAIDLLPTENKLEAVSIAENDSQVAAVPTDSPATITSDKANDPQTGFSTTPSIYNDKTSTVGNNVAQTAADTSISIVGNDSIPSSVQNQDQAIATAVQQQTDTTVIIPGTLIITSIPDSAQIVINDVNVGSTPYNISGFYPGLYDVTLTLNGYQPFKKTIELKSGGTEFLTCSMAKASGFLFVASTPANATVLINDTIVGMTPFTSQALQPGIYNLQIDLPGYNSYVEQLGIAANLTDTLQITLLSKEKPGLFSNTRFKNTQTARRITFGAIGILSTAAGVLLNMKTRDNLEEEQSAWRQYREARLSESEYTTRYSHYRDLTKSTDRYALLRNICYGLGITGGVGFVISVPY